MEGCEKVVWGQGVEPYLAGLYHSSSDAIGFASLDGTLLDVNNAFSRLTGYSREELLGGTRYQDLTPKEYHEFEASLVEMLLSTGESVEYEKEYIRKDGSRVPVLVTTFPVGSKDEKPAGIGEIIKDITERKRMELALRESERRYRELANSLPEIVFELDASGNVTFANRNARVSLGYTRESVKAGVNILDILPLEQHERMKQRIRALLAGQEVGPEEFTAQRRNGGAFPIMVYSTPIRQGDKLTGVRGIAVDITELKEASKAIETSQMRYRSLFENASDGIFIRDLRGNIIEGNQAIAKLLGYRPEEFIGMNVTSFLTPESRQRAVERVRALLRHENATLGYDLECITRNGRHIILESRARLVFKEGEQVAVQAILRDVTEERHRQEVMQSYLSQVIQAQEEERKRIARELHDETAQSLVTLLLDIEEIVRRKDMLPAVVVAKLGVLRDRANGVLAGIRRFSLALRPDVLDQLGLLPALGMLVEELARDSGIAVSMEVTGTERRLASEREVVFFRIVQEALHNARKHSQAAEVMVKVNFGDKEITVRVVDDGRGFEVPELLGDLAMRGKLGLVGIQERVRLAGGRLKVKSGCDKGTTIEVDIPY